jgi:hypothetical protein
MIEEESKYNAADLVVYLKKISFIGPFPRGVEALLVPVEPALQEARGLYPDLKKNAFLQLLKKEGVGVFNTIEEWVRFRDNKK